MRIAKRIFIFVLVNILIVTTISIVTSVLGLQPYLQGYGLNYSSLAVFCLIWGFGGALISLALSRVMAKWMMGVQIIEPGSGDYRARALVQKVHALSRKAGLDVMPQVGIYDSPELNAFATGPTRNRSLVAVSSGLLDRMSETEVEGVLAHEVAHIANGDMVTMTLVQGVVNAFVMFVARILGHLAAQAVEENKRPMVQFAVVIASEILLGFLGMMVVAAFSRYREYRADAGGAELAGKTSMISALQALRMNLNLPAEATADQPESMAALKISSKPGGFLALFSTHPPLEERIARLQGRMI